MSQGKISRGIHMPEKSGFPPAVRGIPGVGKLSHWAATGAARKTATLIMRIGVIIRHDKPECHREGFGVCAAVYFGDAVLNPRERSCRREPGGRICIRSNNACGLISKCGPYHRESRKDGAVLPR